MKKLFTIFLVLFVIVTTNDLYAQASLSPDTPEQSPRIGITVSEKKITIINAPNNLPIKIFSLVGVKVAEFKVASIRQDYYLDVPVGYYIVKAGEQTFKIAIR